MGSRPVSLQLHLPRRDDSWLWRLFTPGSWADWSPLALADFPFHPLGHSLGVSGLQAQGVGKKPNMVGRLGQMDPTGDKA